MRWEHPGSYFGYNPEGHIIAAIQHRDSSIFAESNYAVTGQRLMRAAGATEIPRLEDITHDGPFSSFDPARAPSFYTFRASCSLVGWIEYLMVRPSFRSRALVKECQRIAEALAAYPVLSDVDYSERQFEAMQDYWQHESLRERMDWCREAGVSPLAARHSSPPEAVEQRWSEEMFA
jgi:hypothetical protein